MPIEQKRFAGIMNLDDKPEFVLANQHISSLNLRFYGGAQGLTAQNIPGNTLIANTLPTGDNECIGSFYDSLKQRIFWFNWNSNGRNGIYYYTISTGVISELLISFTDSATDIFDFDLDFPIASVNIVYTTETDGDILTWTDRNSKPKELNILDAQQNLFGANWLAEYLDVCKQPPTIPIACAYQNDATVTVNNLYSAGGYKLMRFKYLFEYGTFQKSACSSISEMPIPFDYTNQAVVTDQTKNNNIGLIFQTGGADVIKIHILAQESLGNVWGNFFNVQILDKSELSIPDNDNYIWAFYNNEAYDYIDQAESDLLFDYVPNKANTQELLNGNVIIYGGITEGYDPVVPDVAIVAEQEVISFGGTSVSIMATQVGTNGLSTGDIRISLVGLPSFAGTGQSSTVQVQILVGSTTYSWAALTASGATTIADMITEFSVLAVADGFTVVSTTSNSIVVNKSGQILLHHDSFGNGNNLKSVDESTPANEFSAKYNYALAYFADKQKTNGVTTSEDFSVAIFPVAFVNTQPLLLYLSNIELTINHRPPLWAKNYQVLRTNNLTKSSFLTWVSDRTFKDDEFAYISIESIAIYKVQHETSVISYDFLVGDRIKFICLFDNDKLITQTYGNSHDYEIVGQIENPDVNGLVQAGKFLKIKLPATTITFDFGNFLSNAYYYYEIELYTPAKSVANNLNVYYEFSQMFEIGNAGTVNAYHQGNDQNQTSDLGTPAISNFRKGDNYYRLREVRAGAFFKADMTKDITYVWANEPVLVMTVENIPVGTSYEVKDTIGGNTTNHNNWLIKTGLSSVNFSISGKLQFAALSNTSNILILYLQIKNSTTGAVTSLEELARITTGATSGQVITFDVNTNVTIAAGRTAVPYLQESPVGIPFSANSLSGVLTFIDTEHDFTIGVIDQNFSDFFESKVNSNGRALVVNPDEKETFYSTLLRWGLSYQQNTNINQINRFYPANFDEVDRSKGDIQRFKTRDRILRVFQNRACGQYGVFAKYIQSNSDVDPLTTTNDIITKGNVNYYAGVAGLGDQYTALISGKNQDYISDSVRGYQWRLSNDGLVPISQLYKGQFFIRDLLIPYNKTYTRAGGGKAKIIGTYDYQLEEAVFILQGSTLDSNPLQAYAFSFNEQRNGYSSFFSYNQAEWIMSAENIIYTWKNGALWKHDNTTTYSNFYTVQYGCYIDVVFNMNLMEVKTWEAIAEVASTIWNCPLIYTSTNSYAGQMQESELIDVDFADLEGQFKASFLRDINSQQGLINGDWLKGEYIVIRFQIDNASNLVTLSQITVMYKDSPLNTK